MIRFEAQTGGVIESAVFAEKLSEMDVFEQKLREHEMTEWLDLPEKMLSEVDDILSTAQEIQEKADCLVCLGIGGSYLGAKAILEAMGGAKKTQILFSGNSFSGVELERVLDELGEKDFAINVISKSGTTLETALAFRIFKEKLIKKYGEEEAYKRIYATTSQDTGALFEEARENGYKSFVIPDGAGGRYSVLSAVGLLPLAVAGVDVKALLEGAKAEKQEQVATREYALARNLLYEQGFETEIFANFEPRLMYVNEWIKQLFGESEGKEGKGIFPGAVEYSTDLHSLGQYMQEGRRELFETFIEGPVNDSSEIKVPEIKAKDGLEKLVGMKLSDINEAALKATEAAHAEGGVPVLRIMLPDWSAKSIGALVFFLEKSCALSALRLGVNPFDQPGVENYKKKMKEILGLK